MSKPTVQVHITERELWLLTDLLGYQSRSVSLRDKLSAAHKDMMQAKRLHNREIKMARKAKAAA